jgi:hypothetical protein
MRKLVDAFPDLLSELTWGLAERHDLIDQLNDALIVAVSFDEQTRVGCIRLRPGRELNVAGRGIIGAEQGKILVVKCRYWVNLDTDSSGRITAIEIPAPPAELTAALVARAQR